MKTTARKSEAYVTVPHVVVNHDPWCNLCTHAQQIDFRLQLALAVTLGMYLWHADVTNAFAEAERPEQMYYMHCDRVFRDWWAERNPTIPLPPDVVVPVLKNLQGHPEAPRLWSVRSHGVIIALEFKNTTHAPCLYYGTFNTEFVIFL
jgi:hypothetical protein